MPAETIDQVIRQLDEQLERYRSQGSRLGYFPALYRKVTVAVKDGIAAGRFEDGLRMEQLDVCFANRYLEAAEQWQQGKPTTTCWRVAFAAADTWPPVVLQHLLLGINAHINLDLGIAVAQAAPGRSLAALQRDFDAINGVLASLVTGVKDELCQVWPLLRFYERLVGDWDDRMINFSLSRARTAAWNVATRLAPLAEARWQSEINATDHKTATLGRLIAAPPIRTRLLLLAVRVGERKSIPETIDLLM